MKPSLNGGDILRRWRSSPLLLTSGSRRAGEPYLALLCRFTGVIVGLILEPVPGARGGMVGISIIAILSLAGSSAPNSSVQPGAKVHRQIPLLGSFRFSFGYLAHYRPFGTGYEKTGLGPRIALILVKGWDIARCFSAMR